jgi:hypothetical protein
MKVSIQQQHNNMSTFQRNGMNENKSSDIRQNNRQINNNNYSNYDLSYCNSTHEEKYKIFNTINMEIKYFKK